MLRGHGVKVSYLTTGDLMDVCTQSMKHGVKLAMMKSAEAIVPYNDDIWEGLNFKE